VLVLPHKSVALRRLPVLHKLPEHTAAAQRTAELPHTVALALLHM